MSDEVIARLSPSPVRRGFALALLLGLGGLMLYLALAAPPRALGWQLFLFGTAAGALVLAVRVRNATAAGLELTETELRDTEGRVLCRMDQVRAVERGAFAFKPSNGFLVRLDKPLPRAWAPGLWWRIGRRIGVGGVTPPAEGKLMADIMAARLLERD